MKDPLVKKGPPSPRKQRQHQKIAQKNAEKVKAMKAPGAMPWNVGLELANGLSSVKVTMKKEHHEIPQVIGEARILTTNFMAFDVFTSERGNQELTQTIEKWIQTLRTDRMDDSLALWNIIDAYFNSMPFICCDDIQTASNKFIRYVSVLEKIKQVIRRALYVNYENCTMPLYVYCQELQEKNRSLVDKMNQSNSVGGDVGLLSENAANAILVYWALSRNDRIAMLIQIFASQSESNTDLFRVLLQGNRDLVWRAMNELGFAEIDTESSRIEVHKEAMDKTLQLNAVHINTAIHENKIQTPSIVKKPVYLATKATQTISEDERQPVDPWIQDLQQIGGVIAETVWNVACQNSMNTVDDLSGMLANELRLTIQHTKNLSKKQLSIGKMLPILLTGARKPVAEENAPMVVKAGYGSVRTEVMYRMETLLGQHHGTSSIDADIISLIDFVEKAVEKIEVVCQVARRAHNYITNSSENITILSKDASFLEKMKYVNETNHLDALPNYIAMAQRKIREQEKKNINIHVKQTINHTPKKGSHIPLAFQPLISSPKINAAVGSIALPLIHKVIKQLYHEKYTHEEFDNQGVESIAFPVFIYEWHVNKYGLRLLAERHMLKFLNAVSMHSHTDQKCHLFARFAQIDPDPLDSSSLKVFLTIVAWWVNRRAEGCLQEITYHSKLGVDLFKLPMLEVEEDICEVINDTIGSYQEADACVRAALRKASTKKNGHYWVDEDKALAISMNGWKIAVGGAKKVLRSLFIEGDLDGDSEMRFDEFYSIISKISPGMRSQNIRRRIGLMRSLLRQRIDADAVWMCHRTIMAEISRYESIKETFPDKSQQMASKITASMEILERQVDQKENGQFSRFRWAVKQVQNVNKNKWSTLADSILHAVKSKTDKHEVKNMLDQARLEMRRSLVMSNEAHDIGEYCENLKKLDAMEHEHI